MRRVEQDRAATLRAGLVAATIVNVHRRKGSRLVQPGDFIREAPKAEDYMDVETAKSFMDRWAVSTQGDSSAETVEGAAVKEA